MPPKRIGRLPGFDYTGYHSYLLTLRTFGRRERFRDARVVAETDRGFRDAASSWAFQFLGYCYMPDHLHLVVSGASRDSDLVRFVSDARQHTSCWHVRRYAIPLWQAGWFDHIIQDDERVERHVSHLLANPVRARLVDRWDHWPFSGTSIAVPDDHVTAPTAP